MGRKGTPFPHLQFVLQRVPPPQIVRMLGKATRPLSGPRPECSVPPPLSLHFNHCNWSLIRRRSSTGHGKLCVHVASLQVLPPYIRRRVCALLIVYFIVCVYRVSLSHHHHHHFICS